MDKPLQHEKLYWSDRLCCNVYYVRTDDAGIVHVVDESGELHYTTSEDLKEIEEA